MAETAKKTAASPSACVVLSGSSAVRIWGLTPPERLGRFFNHRHLPLADAENLPAQASSVLVLRGDHIFDDRLLVELLAKDSIALRRTDDPNSPIVAVHVAKARVREALQWVKEGRIDSGATIEIGSPASVVASTRLVHRKIQASFAIEVSEASRPKIERFLYDSSYKSVTDLVTKWAWPVPARWAVRGCITLGLRPNHVTGLGFGLMVLALWLFSRGNYITGLLAGWAMTFLDTVDGKLARTTLTSSRFGHYLDKLTDLLHPPFWYLAWAQALPHYDSPTPGISLDTVIKLIFVFYVVGRIAEGVCSHRFVSGGMFVWQPLDSYFRLFTARRNTCLILLTLGLALRREDLAIWMVAVWTVATSIFLVLRLTLAWIAWRRGGGKKLGSWLVNVGGASPRTSLAVRVFAQRPTLHV